MAISREGDQGLPGWEFTLEEFSPGGWRAVGTHHDGRSVSLTGSDEMALLRKCVAEARALPEKPHA
jgi:hypothetical protein